MLVEGGSELAVPVTATGDDRSIDAPLVGELMITLGAGVGKVTLTVFEVASVGLPLTTEATMLPVAVMAEPVVLVTVVPQVPAPEGTTPVCWPSKSPLLLSSLTTMVAPDGTPLDVPLTGIAVFGSTSVPFTGLLMVMVTGG